MKRNSRTVTLTLAGLLLGIFLLAVHWLLWGGIKAAAQSLIYFVVMVAVAIAAWAAVSHLLRVKRKEDYVSANLYASLCV